MSPKIIIGYILGVIILMGIFIVVGSKGTTTTAKIDDPDRPVATANTTLFDFGKMTNKDIRQKTFEITNTGKSDLLLTQVATSCDCAYVYVTAGGTKSPKFTMHAKSAWRGKVAPGELAQVEVIYEPAIMPVQGKVERIVTITTNDPEHQTLEFKVQAEVSD